VTLMTRLAACSLAAAMLAGVALPAHAEGRPDTRRYTCEVVQATVQQRRAIVMTTGPHTYGRIVAGQAYCGPTQRAMLQVVPTLDNPRCRAGYYCIEDPFD
jgi:hypothetical protein